MTQIKNENLEVKVIAPTQLSMFLELIEMPLESVILSYIRNLAKSPASSSGSDERDYAEQFFMRDLPAFDIGGFTYDDVKEMFEGLDDCRYSYDMNNPNDYKESVNEWFEYWNRKKAKLKSDLV